MPAGIAELGVAPRGERLAAALLVAGIVALWAGALALALAGGHGEGAHAHHHGAAPSGATGLLALLAMWSAMMVIMMVPPELPSLASRIRPRPGGTPVARAGAFFLGLLAAWTSFSAFAALGHWALERRGLTDAMGVLTDPVAAAVLLGIIGVFQLTPLKRRCLDHCRAELAPLPSEQGAGGAFAVGLRHGTVSMGSCALLMLLPFAHGGMALAPMAAVTALLVVEKLGRRGLLFARAAGAAFVAWSAVTLAGLA